MTREITNDFLPVDISVEICARFRRKVSAFRRFGGSGALYIGGVSGLRTEQRRIVGVVLGLGSLQFFFICIAIAPKMWSKYRLDFLQQVRILQ